MTALPGDVEPLLRGFPGAVLRLDAGGAVRWSNGRLESALGRALVDRPFAEVLDPSSSAAKWDRALARAGSAEGSAAEACELILARGDAGLEARTFTVIGAPEGGGTWLVEHHRDGRLDRMQDRLLELNSDLVNAQRALAQERARLARQRDELERSNAALDDFAHAVSHDVKAPLRNIIQAADWLEADLGASLAGDARESLEMLRARARHLHDMVDALLRYARAGRERAAPELVDVRTLLRGVLLLLQPPAGATIEIAPAMPRFVTAYAPLEQVFLNLVGNAVKHARRDDPVVRIDARDAGGHYEFAVADNGPGIPDEHRERIWRIFHTLQPRDEVDGTGIGLAIVKRVVEGEGGRAWVESTPGTGATFRFLWPKEPSGRRIAPPR